MLNKEAFVIRLLQKFPFLSTARNFLKRDFKLKMGKPLNLDNPQTFNEKIQWLKLYYHNPLLTTLVDKVKVKKFVGDKIGAQYIIPTLGVWSDFADINFEELPSKFVLKTNHDYGGVVICNDRAKFDLSLAREKLNWHLKRNFYYVSREWAYKNVEPRILAEEYLGSLASDDVKDYKFYCFNGEPHILLISSGRQQGRDKMKWSFYDMNFNLLDITKSKRVIDNEASKPVNFAKMIQLATTLSQGFPFVRVDFYNIEGQIYFGELTFYPAAGYGKFEPEEWDEKLGSFIDLTNVSDTF